MLEGRGVEEMELLDRCRHLCQHITTLTGVHTAMIDLNQQTFRLAPFLSDCKMEGSACDAYNTHLYGAYEAERWDGKYIYYCPRGLVFISTPVLIPGTVMEYSVVTGPIIMLNDPEEPFEDAACGGASLEAVPRLTTAQTRSLSELITAAVSSMQLEGLPPDVDSGSQAAVLQMMYDMSSEGGSRTYPIESEHRLQEMIRSGDKKAAQKLLNELLAFLYSNDITAIKPRLRELLTLMGRAAIDGGADVDEIFSLCFCYEQEMERFTSVEALNRWISAILHKFISFVFDLSDIKHQNVIFKTNAFIKEHLGEKLSLDQVADQVYLSKSYFCRVIKDELGCTFTEYVNRLRIERSKTLLRSTNMPIAEIASLVGFDDQSYFTRIFKKQTGVAPGKYREQRPDRAR